MNKEQILAMSLAQTRCEAGLYVRKYGLTPVHGYLSLSNKSSQIPYHNNDHILTVVKWCGRLMGMVTETVLSPKGLILGALFHDFNHSGGKAPDTENVAEAIAQLRVFASIHGYCISEGDLLTAVDCIQCTVFPFTIEPATIEQKIIRDADILQAIELNFEQVLGTNLRSEISVSRGVDVSEEQFAQGQLAFLDTIVMYTEPGAVLWAAMKPTLKAHFEAIVGIR